MITSNKKGWGYNSLRLNVLTHTHTTGGGQYSAIMSVLPDQNEADQGQHGMPVSPSHGNTTMDMEQIMREQIRILQEQRAAVMMNEVIELQRERDLALGRVKSLKKCIEGK